MNPLKVGVHTLTRLCSHHYYLIVELKFYHQKRTPSTLSSTPPHPPLTPLFIPLVLQPLLASLLSLRVSVFGRFIDSELHVWSVSWLAFHVWALDSFLLMDDVPLYETPHFVHLFIWSAFGLSPPFSCYENSSLGILYPLGWKSGVPLSVVILIHFLRRSKLVSKMLFPFCVCIRTHNYYEFTPVSPKCVVIHLFDQSNPNDYAVVLICFL